MVTKVIVEDNEKKILEVGDFLLDREGSLCVVIERTDVEHYKYSVKSIYQHTIANISAKTLEDLTKEAKGFNYRILPKDEFDLVLRRKNS